MAPEVLTQSDTKIPFNVCWRQLLDVANKITSSAKKRTWNSEVLKLQSLLSSSVAPRCSCKNHHRMKGCRGYSNPCCKFPLPFLHCDKARLETQLKIISDVISESPSNSVKVTATSTINLHPQLKGYFQRSLIKLCLCPVITA